MAVHAGGRASWLIAMLAASWGWCATAAEVAPAKREADADALIKRAATEIDTILPKFGGIEQGWKEHRRKLADLRIKRGDLRAELELAEDSVRRADPGRERDLSLLYGRAQAYALLGDAAKFDAALAEWLTAPERPNIARTDRAPITAYLQARAQRFDDAAKTVAAGTNPIARVEQYGYLAVLAHYHGNAAEFERFARATEQAAREVPERLLLPAHRREYYDRHPAYVRQFCGDRAGARRIVYGMEFPVYRLWALEKLIAAEMKAGDRAGYEAAARDAIETSRKGDDPRVFWHLLGVARAQIAGGDRAGALTTIRRADELMANRKGASEASVDLAEAYAQAGDVKTARAMADQALSSMDLQTDRRSLRVAVVYATANDLPAAQQLIQRITTLTNWGRAEAEETDRQIVANLLAAGDIATADAYASGLSRFNSTWLRYDVAEAAARAGDLSIAWRLFATDKTARLANALAAGMARAGRAGEVPDLVRGLPNWERVGALIAAAEALLEDRPLPAAVRHLPSYPM
jgi:hypothetical protein